MTRTGLAMAACILVTACGSGVSGEYGSKNEFNGNWDTVFTFKGDRVEMDLLGATQVGTYKVEDRKVYITIGGQTQALRIDDKGCLDGGVMLGVQCRK